MTTSFRIAFYGVAMAGTLFGFSMGGLVERHWGSLFSGAGVVVLVVINVTLYLADRSSQRRLREQSAELDAETARLRARIESSIAGMASCPACGFRATAVMPTTGGVQP